MVRYDLVERQYGSGYMAYHDKLMEQDDEGKYVEHDSARLAMSRAFSIAAHRAVGQVRKYTGIPYETHPAAVAHILQRADNVTIEMIMAADLHDVVEDTGVPLSVIYEVFGDTVGTLVNGLTKLDYPAGTLRKFKFSSEVLRLSHESKEVKTIKLADSIHNMLDFLANDLKYALEVYLPEKRILLDEALKEGDTTLWNWADKIITDHLGSYHSHNLTILKVVV